MPADAAEEGKASQREEAGAADGGRGSLAGSGPGIEGRA